MKFSYNAASDLSRKLFNKHVDCTNFYKKYCELTNKLYGNRAITYVESCFVMKQILNKTILDI